MPEHVTLSEIGREMGGGADIRYLVELADREKAQVTETWNGELAVSEPTARRILEHYRREVAEHDAAWAAYQRSLLDREAAREAFASAAGEKARASAIAAERAAQLKLHEEGDAPGSDSSTGVWAAGGFPLSPRPSGAALSAGYTASREARSRWERKHPEPTFETWKAANRR